MASFLETKIDEEKTPSPWWLAAVTLLFLFQFFVRGHDVLALPASADESLNIQRAGAAWEFTTEDQASWIPGKLLLYYYLGLFESGQDQALAVARWAVALVTLVSGAAIYGIGKRLFDRRVGLLAMWMLAVMPFAIFFDRMALAGSFALALLLLAIWMLLIWLDHPSQNRSMMTGIIMVLAPLANLATFGIVVVPLLAVILLGKRKVSYTRPLLTIYILFGLAWLVIFMPVILSEAGIEQVVIIEKDVLKIAEEEQGFFANFLDNLWQALDQTATFYWMPALVLTAAGAVVLVGLRWSRAVFLIGLLAVAWLPVITLGAYPASRYLLLGVPFLILLLVAGIFEFCTLINEPGRRHAVERMLAFSFLMYGFSWGLPFLEETIRAPENLLVPEEVHWHYIESTNAGYRGDEYKESEYESSPSSKNDDK